MGNVKYLVSFNTKRSACMASVNNVPVIENFSSSSGTISTGFNITSFVENGKNNIEVMMGAIDPNDKSTLYPDSTCQLIITQDTENSSHEVTSIILSVDGKGNVTASSSANYHGLSSEGRIDETQSEESKKQDLYRAGRDVILTELPTWAWVNATPVSKSDLPEIKQAYKKLWDAMKNRDVGELKEMTLISSREMGIAEGVSPEIIFDSYDLSDNVLDENLSPIDLEWDKYDMVTYCNGRMFRLAVGVYQNSPLRLKNPDGKIFFSYNPYFSIIDGKVTLVR